jgi:hypothetical protein
MATTAEQGATSPSASAAATFALFLQHVEHLEHFEHGALQGVLSAATFETVLHFVHFEHSPPQGSSSTEACSKTVSIFAQAVHALSTAAIAFSQPSHASSTAATVFEHAFPQADALPHSPPAHAPPRWHGHCFSTAAFSLVVPAPSPAANNNAMHKDFRSMTHVPFRGPGGEKKWPRSIGFP